MRSFRVNQWFLKEVLIRWFILMLCSLAVGLMLMLPARAAVIKSISVSGLKYSNKQMVLRELPFEEGDTWDDADVATSERRLRNLGVFSAVTVFSPDEQGHVNIQVNDRWPLWLLPEATRKDGGASSVGVALTHYNLWGLRHRLRISDAVDTGKNFTDVRGNAFSAAYTWYRVADSKYSIDTAVLDGSSSLDVFNNAVFTSSYRRDSKDFSLGVSYALGAVPGEGWDIRVGTSLSDTRYQLKQGPVQPDVQNRRRNAMSLGLNYRWLDDHINWLTGTEFHYVGEAAMPWLGSTISVQKHSAGWFKHIPIGQQNTLDFRLNTGWMQGDILRDGLFDVGDGKAIRGYYPGDLQGSAFAFGTVETRIVWPRYDNIQWVAFVDAGHITRDGKRALGKSLIAGAGGGVRWTFRWLVNGTIRVDAAYGTALHRWRLHLGTGQAF